MTTIRLHGAIALASLGLAFIACSDKGTSNQDGSGGSPATGGNASSGTGGSGSSQASGGGANTLDRDALAANCDGVEAKQDSSCTQASLVCRDSGGASCVCGGVSSTNKTGTGGGPDSGAGGRFGGGPPGQPAPAPAGDLVWECFGVGQGVPLGGAGGEGPGGLGGLGGLGGAN
jgi:hypothetical protein